MTQAEFKIFIEGKTIASVELDTIDQYRGGDLEPTCITITKITFTDSTVVEMGSCSYVDKVMMQTILHPSKQ